MELRTSRLLLREFRESDYDAYRAMESHPDIQRYERDMPDEENIQYRFQKILQDAQVQPRTHYQFAVVIPPDDTVRGRINLTFASPPRQEWEIGWRFARDYWGQGYATEAAREVMRFTFQTLKAHRMVAFCHSENIASARVMQKLGMQEEGHTRQTVWINGRWWDEKFFAILENEFAAGAQQVFNG